MHFSLPDIYPFYALPVLLALLLGILLPVARHITDRQLRRQYFVLQMITFVSAIVGAKLAFLFGEYHWPFRAVENWQQVIYSGRSIIGALIFGLLGAEIAKPLLRYPLRPNDRFAAKLPFAFAIGRIGCLMTGCCRGIPYDGFCAVTYEDSIARHPVAAYEIVFQLIAGCVAVWLVKTQRMVGHVFSLYLIAYGTFRFWSEFVRDTPKTLASLSGYQWMSIVMILLGLVFMAQRVMFPSSSWQPKLTDNTVPAQDN
jgi:phosphatidylglycerol---prolipoprotein diacylglyceryl transferase